MILLLATAPGKLTVPRSNHIIVWQSALGMNRIYVGDARVLMLNYPQAAFRHCLDFAIGLEDKRANLRRHKR